MYSIFLKNEDVENGLGFSVALEMARLMSVGDCNVSVRDEGIVVAECRNGEVLK